MYRKFHLESLKLLTKAAVYLYVPLFYFPFTVVLFYVLLLASLSGIFALSSSMPGGESSLEE